MISLDLSCSCIPVSQNSSQLRHQPAEKHVSRTLHAPLHPPKTYSSPPTSLNKHCLGLGTLPDIPPVMSVHADEDVEKIHMSFRSPYSPATMSAPRPHDVTCSPCIATNQVGVCA